MLISLSIPRLFIDHFFSHTKNTCLMEKASNLNLAANQAFAAFTSKPGSPSPELLSPANLCLVKGGSCGGSALTSGDKRRRRTGG